MLFLFVCCLTIMCSYQCVKFLVFLRAAGCLCQTFLFLWRENKSLFWGSSNWSRLFRWHWSPQITSGMLLRIWLGVTFPPLKGRGDATHSSAFFSRKEYPHALPTPTSRQEGGAQKSTGWSCSPWSVEKVMELLALGGTSRHRKVTKRRLHRFTKRISCLTKPDSLLWWNEWVGGWGGTAGDVVHLDFSRAFDTVFVTAEQMEGGVKKEREDRLEGMVSGTKSKWRPVTGSDWVQCCPTTSSMIWMMGQSIPTADRKLGVHWAGVLGSCAASREAWAGWRNGWQEPPGAQEGGVQSPVELGRKRQQCLLGTEWLGSSLAGKDPAGTRMDVSQVYSSSKES